MAGHHGRQWNYRGHHRCLLMGIVSWHQRRLLLKSLCNIDWHEVYDNTFELTWPLHPADQPGRAISTLSKAQRSNDIWTGLKMRRESSWQREALQYLISNTQQSVSSRANDFHFKRLIPWLCELEFKKPLLSILSTASHTSIKWGVPLPLRCALNADPDLGVPPQPLPHQQWPTFQDQHQKWFSPEEEYF